MSRRGKHIILMTVILGAFGFLPFMTQLPAQPLDFSHRIHAGVNKIPCQYCHTGARRSSSAGIPPVARCMGCHKIIATDRPEIVKLKGYFDRAESIPWIRFYDLPDFSYFIHSPHIAAELACQTCHGAVETKDRFREIPKLEMGWCIECHQEKGASVDCLTCHR